MYKNQVKIYRLYGVIWPLIFLAVFGIKDTKLSACTFPRRLKPYTYTYLHTHTKYKYIYMAVHINKVVQF